MLPLLDYNLPEEPSADARPWLATPLARPLGDELARADLERTISVFADLADTLAQIADRGFAHRDIKPENVFWLDERVVIGDFGLVDYPGKDSVTAGNRKLGSTFYLAPEMLNGPRDADCRAAVVYSLAKTLWVMATGQRYPLPGEQRDSIYQMRLNTYVGHRRARPLDEMVDRATRLDPDSRPTMRELAEKLRAWAEGRFEVRPTRPRRFTRFELAKVGVEIIDPSGVALACRACGQGWSPNLRPGGHLPREYWQCLRGCNA